jgi:hypothetical protein
VFRRKKKGVAGKSFFFFLKAHNRLKRGVKNLKMKRCNGRHEPWAIHMYGSDALVQ